MFHILSLSMSTNMLTSTSVSTAYQTYVIRSAVKFVISDFILSVGYQEGYSSNDILYTSV